MTVVRPENFPLLKEALDVVWLDLGEGPCPGAYDLPYPEGELIEAEGALDSLSLGDRVRLCIGDPYQQEQVAGRSGALGLLDRVLGHAAEDT